MSMPVSSDAMPTYDYRCDLCQEQFELWQSFSDDSLVTCPVEGGPPACQAPGEGPVKKVFSKVGISFKGDGFYKNDHGANATRRKEKEKSDSSAGPDSSSKSSDSGSGSGSGGSGSDTSSKSGGSGSGSGSGSTANSKPSSSDKVTR
jgi:putative FmdB family regulatory protein